MSYEKDQFSGPGGGDGSVSISSMISTALGPYITSASVATALAPYLTSASAALSTYVTSSSLATALGPYLTSASAALGTYVTSSSLATALGAYATSSSLATALSAKHANITIQDEGGQVAAAGAATTINFVGTGISASFTGATLTVTSTAGGGEGSVSISTMISTALGGGYTGTASLTALTIAGKPTGSVLLSTTNITGANFFSFSGSWSDYGVLQVYAMFRPESGSSTTHSAAIYSDGGTTPFLSIATASTTASTNQIVFVDMRVMGINGKAAKSMAIDVYKQTGLTNFAVTATANTAFVNALRYSTSTTLTQGVAYLFGWRSI